jgi:hypothetical protein
MSSKREIRAALARLKSGDVTLSPHQYHELLAALEQLFEALVLAPKGTDPVATAVWYNHERRPALARLADAVSPQTDRNAVQTLADQQRSDRDVIRELHRSLLDSSAR